MQETWVLSLGWEDPLEKGKAYPLQYSGLENSMDCIVHGVTKSRDMTERLWLCSAGMPSSIPGPGRSYLPQSNWALPLEPLLNSWAHAPQLLKPACSGACVPKQEKSLQREARAPQLESSPRSPQPEKALGQQRRPSAARKTKVLKRPCKMLQMGQKRGPRA